MDINDLFAQYVKSSTAAVPDKTDAVVSVSANKFVRDTTRAAVLADERRLVEGLLETVELDDDIRAMLSINLSTSAAARTREIPTYTDKLQALWDYWKFIEIINFHGGPLSFSECHRDGVAWKYRSGAKLRQMVLEPRGHLKSTLHCVGYTLWRMYQNPNWRGFVGTESLKLSKAFIREVEDYLVDDFNIEHVWNDRPHFTGPMIPSMDSMGKQRRQLVRDLADEFGDQLPGGADKKKVWRAEAIQVIRTRSYKEPTITAGSVGQASTGFHFDEVIFDDVHTYDNSSSEEKINKVFAFIFDIESVLDPPYVDIELTTRLQATLGADFNKAARWCISGGRQTVLGTRYDDLDFYGHILEHYDALGYEVRQRNIYANGTDNEDGYLWPEKWNETLEEQTKAQFEKRYGATGLRRFYSQYLNRIVSPENSVFEWDKINYIHPDNYKLCDDGWVEVYAHDHTIIAEFKPILVIDPTATATTTSDFCAIAVGGRTPTGLWVCDFWMKKETPRVWLDKMYELINKWNLFVANIEMVGGFKVLEHTIQQMWVLDREKYRPISVKSYSPPMGANAESKAQRIEVTLSPLVFNGMLNLPLAASRNQDLKKQFMFFGKGTTKDDGPDVLAILEELAVSSKRNRSVITPLQHSNVLPFGGVRMDEPERIYGGVTYAA
jgi:hypothetical protein